VTATPREPEGLPLHQRPERLHADLQICIEDLRVMNAYVVERNLSMSQELVTRLAQLLTFEGGEPTTSLEESIGGVVEGPDGTSRPKPRIRPSDSPARQLEFAMTTRSMLASLMDPVTPDSLRETQVRAWIFIKNPAINLLLLILMVSVVGLGVTILVTDPLRHSAGDTSASLLPLVLAASLGSSFYALSTGRRYVVDRTFDPRYTFAYVLRFGIGLASGLILGLFGEELLGGAFEQLNRPEDTASGGGTSGNAASVGHTAAHVRNLAPPVLALIGGFAADAVRALLQRIADVLVAAVGGSQTDIRDADRAQVEVEAEREATRQRSEIVSELSELRADDALPEAAREHVRRLIRSILER
jgi:hypothetical protein